MVSIRKLEKIEFEVEFFARIHRLENMVVMQLY